MGLENIPVVVHLRYPLNLAGVKSKLTYRTPRGTILELTLKKLRERFERVYLFSEFADAVFPALEELLGEEFRKILRDYVSASLNLNEFRGLLENSWDYFFVVRGEDFLPPLDDFERLAGEIALTLPDAVKLLPSWHRFPPLLFESSSFMEALSKMKLEPGKDIFEGVFNFLSARSSKYRVEHRFQKGVLGWEKLNLSCYTLRDVRTVLNILDEGLYDRPADLLDKLLSDPLFFFHVPVYYRLRYGQWGNELPSVIFSLMESASCLNDELIFVFEDFTSEPLVRVLSFLNEKLSGEREWVFRSFWEIDSSVFRDLLSRYTKVFSFKNTEFIVKFGGEDLTYELNSLMDRRFAPVHLSVSADEVGDEKLLELYRKYAPILRKVPDRYFSIRSSHPQPYPRFPCWEALRGAFFLTSSEKGGRLKFGLCPVGEEKGSFPEDSLEELLFSDEVVSYKRKQLEMDFSACPPTCHLWFRAVF